MNNIRMEKSGARISPESSRIARNTVLLYVRVLLMMFIGLFTSRIVLKTLGVDDFGVYNVVGGLVTVFTLLTDSVSQAVSRFLAYTLGERNLDKLRRVFASSVVIQIALSLIIVLLVESVGMWFMHHSLNIPPDRLGAASWVLHCCLGVLVLRLLSVPYNAVIIAHEKMSAFAWISILEAVLKLGVALLLLVSGADKLKTYAVLMLAVALVIRMTYGAYCRSRFEESRTSPSFDRGMLREMASFAGWNFLGTGTWILNTSGVNILSNIFFGVGVNAARGIASQVENIVKQFATNFLTALNPQIIKSYADSRKDYAFVLAGKGVKFTFLVILLFAVPLWFESDALLRLWLGQVPQHAPLFVRLAVIALFADLVCNSVMQLVMASGRIKRFYIITSAISITVLPLCYLAFHSGLPAEAAYVIFTIVYLAMDGARVVIASRQEGFPMGEFLRGTVAPLILVTVISFLVTWAVFSLMDPGIWRLVAVLAASTVSIAASSWLLALTPGERRYFSDKLSVWRRK